VKMSYLVFARKWRPQNFDEVIGQEHIATTLKNAISLDRVGHAYLFSGSRGIGKTSTARILAKALNCQKGPIATPCNRCDGCSEISEGRSLDVIEIDGASNRGIEQIRQLRENVKFAPAKSRFKVYIIDEVHQITTDGFNALLKTLEEPPKHVKFIFATTQAHKVLPTILSRCQRFDFKPLSVSSIAQKLKKIIKQEKLNIGQEALLYVARAASGSMRDAESILDQLSSSSRGEIKLETVTQILGMINLEALGELAQQIIDKKTPGALKLVEDIINEGKDLFQFTAGLMEHFRNILVVKTVDKKNIDNFIDLPKEHIMLLSKQADLLNLEEIFYIFNILTHAQGNLRRALSSRVIVEMALVKLTQRENLSSLQEIMKRLSALEQRLKDSSYEEQDEVRPVLKAAEIKEKPSVVSAPKLNSSTEAPSSLQEKIWQSWPTIVKAIKNEKMFVASALEFAKVRQLNENTLNISFSPKHTFYQETLEEAENKKFIETKLKEIFKRDLKIKISVDNDLDDSQDEPGVYIEEDLSIEEEGQGQAQPKATGKKGSSEPIIQSALKIFHGRVIRRSR